MVPGLSYIRFKLRKQVENLHSTPLAIAGPNYQSPCAEMPLCLPGIGLCILQRRAGNPDPNVYCKQKSKSYSCRALTGKQHGRVDFVPLDLGSGAAALCPLRNCIVYIRYPLSGILRCAVVSLRLAWIKGELRNHDPRPQCSVFFLIPLLYVSVVLGLDLTPLQRACRSPRSPLHLCCAHHSLGCLHNNPP